MIVSATPHVAHTPLSDIYHATGVSAADRAAVALMWQAIWGIFNAMLYVGFLVITIGLFVLGIAMFRAQSFGRGIGWAIVILGLVDFVAAVFQMIFPSSIIGVGSYFACLISYFVLGWKVCNLSKAL
jgi:membrane-associated HD superfamily phosphohydrolase